MSEIHPAVQASMNSAKFAMARDKESWLALFAEDAYLADPVGPSPFDPKGEGYTGKAHIERFFQNAVARSNLTIEAVQRIPCGNSCAAVLKVTNDLGGGKKTVIDMIGIYEVNDEGKIISMKVYWSFPDLAKQLAALGIG